MKNSEYWEDAALLREIAVQEGATASAADILKLYDEALSDIDEEIRKIKYNFQKRFGLDDETAAYFLEQSQQEENLNNLIKALEAAPNEKARQDILEYIHRDGLSVRAYAARTERYEAVKISIYARMKKLAAEGIGLLGGMLKNAYKESYYGVMDDTAKGINAGINFALLNDDAINEAVNAKWHGKRFSERIWDNTDRLAKEAQELVVKSFMSGESLTKTSRKLAESFQVEKYHATTLVHTETAHIHAVADMKAYEDLGVKEYKYLATLDYATCEICQPLDGMVFRLSEAREGVNYPVMHPRCRCTTTVNMNYISRRARNPLTEKNELVDGNMTYEQWKNSLTPEQKQALELSQKKDSNKTADKLQFERYKKVLGTKEVGRSFDKFRDLKYNNKEKYEELKGFYRYKCNNIKSTLNDYHCVRELQELGIKGSIHIPSKEIDAKSLAFNDEHINQQRNHNVSEKEAKQFIDTAILSITKRNGLSENYYSRNGIAYVNPLENKIMTAFKESEFKGDALTIMEVLKRYGY